MPFRVTPTACGGDTLTERYDKTLSHMGRITQGEYQVKAQWECEFELAKDMKVNNTFP